MILHPVLSIGLMVLMGFGAFVSSIFLWVLWYRDTARPRSWLLCTLAISATALTLGGWYLGWIAYIRITEGLAKVPIWTSSLTTITVLVMGGVPIYLLVQFLRHSGPHSRP